MPRIGFVVWNDIYWLNTFPHWIISILIQGAFFYVYIVLSVVFGIPLLFFEVAIGQYTNKGLMKVFHIIPVAEGKFTFWIFWLYVMPLYYFWFTSVPRQNHCIMSIGERILVVDLWYREIVNQCQSKNHLRRFVIAIWWLSFSSSKALDNFNVMLVIDNCANSGWWCRQWLY